MVHAVFLFLIGYSFSYLYLVLVPIVFLALVRSDGTMNAEDTTVQTGDDTVVKEENLDLAEEANPDQTADPAKKKKRKKKKAKKTGTLLMNSE